MNTPIENGTKVFTELEEQEVTIIQSEAGKASALSTENDCYDYLIENVKGEQYWISFDQIMETHGDDDDPFIF